MYYASAGLSEKEILGEKSLVIYITECQNNCIGCHTPYMHKQYGDILINNFTMIYEVYRNYISCVCFMGEGLNNKESKEEFKKYCEIIHNDGKKTALYSGRDCLVEEWMKIFNYIKLGSYKKDCGPLTNINTNQRLYKKDNKNKYNDITYLFWNK